MKRKYNVFPLLIMILCVLFINGNAQEKEETKNKTFKNTLSTNITNPSLISSKYITIGYERVLKNNQTFSLSLGRFSLPRFGSSKTDSLNIKKDFKDKGIHFAADYRFYLRSENRHNAPRGVYIGPYYSLNYLSRENQWELNSEHFDGNVVTDLSFSINTIGMELGYQFIFWDRLAVDFILLGPGLGFYGIKTKLSTTLTANDESLFFEKLNELLADKIPGYEKVIAPVEFSQKGSFKTTTLGYRYLINVGFRF